MALAHSFTRSAPSLTSPLDCILVLLAGDWVQSPVGTTLTIPSTDFGAQGVGVSVSQTGSSATATLRTALTGATTTVVVTPTSGTFDTTNAITINSHATTPIPIVVDESATTKWGDIGDWGVGCVADFSFAFSKHRNAAGGSYENDGNPKAANFDGAGLSKWITASVTTLGSIFHSAGEMNADLSGWKVAKVKTLKDTFAFSSKFAGVGLDLWDISEVKNMGTTFISATSLTPCSKRLIADAWAGVTAFTATSYDEDWASEPWCIRVNDANFKEASCKLLKFTFPHPNITAPYM